MNSGSLLVCPPRGRAFSLLGLAGSLRLAAVPPANQLLIETFGWRAAWRIDALVIWPVLLPALALLIRNRFEEIGQTRDGIRRIDRLDADGPDRAADQTGGLSLREASRTIAFWGLVGASVVPSLGVTGLAFNQVAILTDRGLPSTLVATTFAVESAIGMLTALMVGWLTGQFPVRYVLAAGQLCLAVAMVSLLLSSQTPELTLLYSARRGASSGLWMVAVDVAWPGYFGRRHFGSICSVGISVGAPARPSARCPSGSSTISSVAMTRRSRRCSCYPWPRPVRCCWRSPRSWMVTTALPTGSAPGTRAAVGPQAHFPCCHSQQLLMTLKVTTGE